MRRALWLPILLAAAAGAQRQRTGDLSREMLAAHNAVRARVGVEPLVWSGKLAGRARDWAETLLAREQFAHRPNSPFGENLFEIDGAPATPEQVLDAWASEARDYDYRSNRCRAVCGHYTQIVWRGTREIGCAVAHDRNREVWVCNYDPPGNWVGNRPY